MDWVSPMEPIVGPLPLVPQTPNLATECRFFRFLLNSDEFDKEN